MRDLKFLTAIAFCLVHQLSAYADTQTAERLKPVLICIIPMTLLILLCLLIMLRKKNPETQEEQEVPPVKQILKPIKKPAYKKPAPQMPQIHLVPEIKEIPAVQKALNFIRPNKSEEINEEQDLPLPFKPRSPITEADEIILSERNSFFESISPIEDITGEAKEKEEINKPKEPEFADFDRLMVAYENKLKFAHKVQSDVELPPEIIDTFAVDDKTAFSLVRYGSKTSLVGNISDKVFILKTFKNNEITENSLYIEFCSQTYTYSTYAVILNNFKSLIKVTPTEIYLWGDMN